MTPYNHAYYNDLMEQCGLSKAKDLYAYILNTPEELPQKINRVAEIALKSGIRVRTDRHEAFSPRYADIQGCL